MIHIDDIKLIAKIQQLYHPIEITEILRNDIRMSFQKDTYNIHGKTREKWRKKNTYLKSNKTIQSMVGNVI